MSLRVVCVGTGLVGQQGIMAVLDHPEWELVAVVVHSDDKVGRDVGELVGRPPVGLTAIQSLESALALKPDVVAYFNTTHGRLKATIEEFVTILASGANVVTTSVGALINPNTARPDVLAKLNDACREGGTTLFSTGIDPGVFSDFIPIALSGCGRRIDGIRIFEMATYESGQQSDMVAFEQVGFGLPIDTVTPLVHPDGLRVTWGSAIQMMAAELGVTLDEIEVGHEMLPSPETFPYQGRIIEQGTITAMRAINAIPLVVASEPGVKSVFDLPVITGRGRLA